MEKQLPQNIEAECGVLGSIIIDPEAIVQVADFLHADDFYRDAHRTIYETILQLYEQREAADFITICDELERRNKLEDVGGASYITSLINQVPTSGNVEYYGRIVERNAILRRLIHAAAQIAATAYEETDADVALDKAEQLIFNISQRHARSDFSSLRDILSEYMNKLDQLHERRGTIVGVPTGFADLDRLTGGLQKSDLIVLAARPAVGKCLPAWTLIDHPETGERLTIEEFVRRRIPAVYSLSDTSTIQISQVADWVDSGIKPCYRVQTRLGRMVEVTGHHPFLTIHGWIPLHDLKAGQYIAVPTRVGCFGSDESWPIEKVRLLAYYLAKEKRFPTCIWTWSKRYLAEFLRALMSCDGSIYASKAIEHRPIIEFTVASQQLARDVCHALLRFGILGKYHQTTYNAWRVHITSAEDVRRYQEQIGWIGEKSTRFTNSTYVGQLRGRNNGHAPLETWELVRSASREKGISLTELARRSGETEKVGKYAGYNAHTNRTISGRRLAAYAEVLEDISLQRIASPDIYWDEIISIEPIGEHQVYDLTVPDGANFIAQDVFVHNTSLALSLAHNTAIKHQQSVAIFSLEMSKEQLVQRLLSMDAGIDQQRLRTGWIEDDEWERIVYAMGTLSEANIWIDDTAGISTVEMRSKARRLQAEHGIDLIIVDYLQLMQALSNSGKRNENRVQEISEISRNLKGLARELNVPVLALAQLSRAVESRQSKVPQLSDLRESGCLAGETSIYLPDLGIYKPIEQLAGQTGFRVLALNTKTWQLEPAPVSNAFATGRKPVYTMTTRLGRTIRATANHKFLTIQGWQRLDELSLGQEIALPYQEVHKRHQPNEMAGLRVGAGVVRMWGVGPCGRPLLGDSMNEPIRESESGRPQGPPPIPTSTPAPTRSPGQYPLSHFSLVDASRAQFIAPSAQHMTGREDYGEGAMNCAPTATLSEPIQGDIYWDEIISIEPDGETDVYDLTVEAHHNFIANNIVAHNSIEQDSDIVMFIYRDDVYNPESERKNIADIIIAKHRNGPVGEVSLYFQASQTRFRDLELNPTAE